MTPRSAEEQKLIAYLAFPDSNIFARKGQYDACFSFRVRSCMADTPAVSSSSNVAVNRPAANAGPRNGHLIGSTYFRQRPDPNNPRGSSQVAVVVVFFQLRSGLRHVGAIFFDPKRSGLRHVGAIHGFLDHVTGPTGMRP